MAFLISSRMKSRNRFTINAFALIYLFFDGSKQICPHASLGNRLHSGSDQSCVSAMCYLTVSVGNMLTAKEKRKEQVV